MLSSARILRATLQRPSITLTPLLFARIQKRTVSDKKPKIDITIDPQAMAMPKNRGGTKKRRNKSYRFVDRMRLVATGGTGGSGGLSVYKIARKNHRRPNGGNGGHGGSVVLVADPALQTLQRDSPHVRAQDGGPGRAKDCHGQHGINTIVRVPPGIIVKRVLQLDEVYDEKTSTIRKLEDNNFDPYSNFTYDPNNKNHNEEDEEFNYQDFKDPLPAPVVVPKPDPPKHIFQTQREEDEAESDYDSEDYDDESLEENDTGAEYGSDTDEAMDGEEDEEEEDEYDANNEEAMDGKEYEEDEEEEEEEEEEERMTFTLGDLDKPGAHLVVARGGRGGRGTGSLAGRSAPMLPDFVLRKRARPTDGETVHLELELKLIADLGLVGFPNAGKSSLLNAMSKASPKVAPYPFTTLHPLLGYIEYQDGYRVRAADIPGLIEGASHGRGCGFEFLKHVERTKALLYIVDAASVDLRSPIDDLRILANELSTYGDGSLMERRALVVANKVDLLHNDHAKEIISDLHEAAEEAGIQFHGNVYGISAGVTGKGLGVLAKAIRHVVTETEKERQEEMEANFEGLPL